MMKKIQVSAARPVFIGLASRDLGMARDAAAREFDEFLTINGVVRNYESYLTLRRIENPIPLVIPGKTVRGVRQTIYQTFANALNHANFN